MGRSDNTGSHPHRLQWTYGRTFPFSCGTDSPVQPPPESPDTETSRHTIPQVTPSPVHVSWPLKGRRAGDGHYRSTGTFGRRPPGATQVWEPPVPMGGSPARRLAVRATAPASGQPLHAPPGRLATRSVLNWTEHKGPVLLQTVCLVSLPTP